MYLVARTLALDELAQFKRGDFRTILLLGCGVLLGPEIGRVAAEQYEWKQKESPPGVSGERNSLITFEPCQHKKRQSNAD